MKAEIIAIGSELVLGDSVDTNSAWISARLAEIGVSVVRHTTVSDGMDDMVEAVRQALARADVVLTTGGLGPTQDDLTRIAVATVAGVGLARDAAMAEEIAAYFQSRGRPMSSSNLQQADLPHGAVWMTRVGSAPGFRLDVEPDADGVGGGLVCCMPGVPREMTVMAQTDVLPLLRRRAGAATTVSRMVRTSGLSESGIADALADLAAVQGRGPTVAFLASRGETRVKVTATAPDRAQALTEIDPVIAEIVERLGAGVVGLDDEGVEHAIGRLLLGMGATLGVAESVTGGGVAARLTSVAGASGWFRGCLVTYATDVKASLAGVDPALLARFGPVSAETAGALAVAAARRLQADWGLAVVGVAGPDSVGDTPPGVVRVAVVGPDGRGTHVREMRMPDRNRADIQEFGASSALNLLHHALSEAVSGP